MDLNLLNGVSLFTALIQAGSFTETAARTGHSKSYISKEINRLEERLGVRLLNRTTRSLSLTPEGEYFLTQCTQVLDQMEEATQALGGQQQEPSGRLKVGCPVSFGLSQLRPLLPAFTRRYPKIQLELVLDDRKADIIQDGYDLVIRASTRLDDSSLIARRLFTTDSLTLASPDYLRRWGRPDSPMDLANHRVLCYSNLSNPTLWHFERKAFPFNSKATEPAGDISVRVNPFVITNSSEMELAMTLDGEGICRLPRFYLTDELETGKLEALFPEFVNPSVEAYVIYPSRKHMSSKLRAFIEFAQDAFQGLESEVCKQR